MKIFPVRDFKKFVFLFSAGGGEFIFRNPRSNEDVQFNLKFTRLFTDSWSSIEVNWSTQTTKALLYFQIGRYDFKTKKLQLKSDCVMPRKGLEIAVQFLQNIFEYVNIGSGLEGIDIYHTDRCCRCCKRLTNLKSLAIGFGGECEEYYKKELSKIQLNLF